MRKQLKRVRVIDDEEPVPPLLADTSDAEEVEDRLANLAHVQRLADAMAPDPTEWEYRGEVSDAGGPVAKCTCGHPIRYVFHIHRKVARKGRPAILPIGSVCIETSVPYLMQHGAETLATSLQAALEAHRKAIEEAKRREREAANSGRVELLTAEYTKLEAWVKEERERAAANNIRWLPGVLYSGLGKRPKALSTAGRTAAALIRKYVTGWLACFNTAADSRQPDLWAPVPVPEVKELREALARRMSEDVSIKRGQAERNEEYATRYGSGDAHYTAEAQRLCGIEARYTAAIEELGK